MFDGLDNIYIWLIVFGAAHILLMVLALTDIVVRKDKDVNGGRRLPWTVAIIGLAIVGPLLYFFIGRHSSQIKNNES